MLSKSLHSIGNSINLIVLTNYQVNTLFLWFPIINNIILNYLVFGFKNIRIHILNVIVILMQLFSLSIYVDSDKQLVNFITPILWLIYMINNVVYFKKENKSLFYSICIILMLFTTLTIFSIILYDSYAIALLYFNFILGLIVLISNIYLSDNYLTNKYLKYITILINLVYVIITVYCLFAGGL